MQFISEDKLTINLPVPLDTEVYEFITSCNDSCLSQKEKFDEIFPPKKGGRCNRDMPCHTDIHSIQRRPLTLSNIYKILPIWGISAFKTEEEATAAGKKLVKQHQEELLKLGLEI